jgi:hypothetical protein
MKPTNQKAPVPKSEREQIWDDAMRAFIAADEFTVNRARRNELIGYLKELYFKENKPTNNAK